MAEISFEKGDYRKAFAGNVDTMAKAATGAMKETGEAARDAVRGHLAAAGFGPKWQNATRANCRNSWVRSAVRRPYLSAAIPAGSSNAAKTIA